MISCDSNSLLLHSTSNLPYWVIRFLGERTSWQKNPTLGADNKFDVGWRGGLEGGLANVERRLISPVEMAACQRVQQKAAGVISQLSERKEVAVKFVSLNCKFSLYFGTIYAIFVSFCGLIGKFISFSYFYWLVERWICLLICLKCCHEYPTATRSYHVPSLFSNSYFYVIIRKFQK